MMPFSPGTNAPCSLIANVRLLSPQKWGHLAAHGGCRLSNVNHHYRGASSLRLLVFPRAHGCFHNSGQSPWEPPGCL